MSSGDIGSYSTIISTVVASSLAVITIYLTPLIKERFELRGQYFVPFKRWCSDSYGDLKEFKVRYVESNFRFSNISDIHIILDYWSLHSICVNAYNWIGKIKKDDPALGEEQVDLIEDIEIFWHRLENSYGSKLPSVDTAKQFNAEIKKLEKSERKEIADKIRQHLLEKRAEYSENDEETFRRILNYLHDNAPSDIAKSLRQKIREYSMNIVKPCIEVKELELKKIELTSLGGDSEIIDAMIWTIPVYNNICNYSMSRDALDCMAELSIFKDNSEPLFRCHLLWKGPGKLPDELQNRNDLGDITPKEKKGALFYIGNLLGKRKYTTIPKGRHNKLLFLFTFSKSEYVYIIGTTISEPVEQSIRRDDNIISIPINKINTYTFKMKLFERKRANNRQLGIKEFNVKI